MIESFKYYYSRFGIAGLTSVIKAKFTKSDILIKVIRKDIKHPFSLRYRTSDLPTFEQVFIDNEYDFVTENPPKVIVDAGANIGLASIYFANKFPDSEIFAIEPETSNYELLCSNVAPYSNIRPLKAALWDKNEEISLVDPGLGKWGFMTQGKKSEESLGNVCHKVPGVTIDKIMEDNKLPSIDILKIDIEGAEREVFHNTSSWIDRVDAIIIELHERMKSGCNRSFYNGSNGFDIEWAQGENIYLSRGKYLTKRTQL